MKKNCSEGASSRQGPRTQTAKPSTLNSRTPKHSKPSELLWSWQRVLPELGPSQARPRPAQICSTESFLLETIYSMQYTHGHTYIHTYIYIYLYTHTHTRSHPYPYIYNVCVYVIIYTYMHTYLPPIYIHTYIHTHIWMHVVFMYTWILLNLYTCRSWGSWAEVGLKRSCGMPLTKNTSLIVRNLGTPVWGSREPTAKGCELKINQRFRPMSWQICCNSSW